MNGGALIRSPPHRPAAPRPCTPCTAPRLPSSPPDRRPTPRTGSTMPCGNHRHTATRLLACSARFPCAERLSRRRVSLRGIPAEPQKTGSNAGALPSQSPAGRLAYGKHSSVVLSLLSAGRAECKCCCLVVAVDRGRRKEGSPPAGFRRVSRYLQA